jgi:hypothetical protein
VINLLGQRYCQYPINNVEPCPHLAKVKVIRPNPIDPTSVAKYYCYSHLSAFAKNSKGQFLVDPIQGEK